VAGSGIRYSFIHLSFPGKHDLLFTIACRGIDTGSTVDPDSKGPLETYLDPASQSESGSGRTKITHKHSKKLLNFIFEVLDVLF
jgi:hypothetical protein